MRTRYCLLLILLLCGGAAALVVGCGRQRPVLPEETSAPAQAQPSPGSLAAREEAGPFHFSSDRGTKLLAEALSPSEQLPRLASDQPSGPRPFATPPLFQRPQLTRPDNLAAAPAFRPALPPRSLRPRPVPEEVPLALTLPEPVVPEQPLLVAGPRVREASPDLREPLPLDLLGQKQPEVPPADDPTTDASTAAAQVPPALQRTRPAPFLRLNLPDPHEHRQAVRLRKEWAEEPMPVTAPPRLPGR
jgi:hypothetical protein